MLSLQSFFCFHIVNFIKLKSFKGNHVMDINRYISINSSLFVIGLYSNITIVISIFSIYHAVKLIRNSYKCGLCINKSIVLIVAMFLMLDFFDLVRFIFE